MAEPLWGNVKFAVLKSGVLWAIVYGLMNAVFSGLVLPAAPVIALRPQVAIPMLIGFISGPIPGFVTGALGNVIGDGLSGYGLLTFWNWHVTNGLMGFIPGLTALYAGTRIVRTLWGFAILEASIVGGCAVAVGFAVITDILFLHLMEFPQSINAWILPAFITNAVQGFIIVPALCLITRRLTMTLETRTILIITALLVLAVLATSFTITWNVWDDLKSKSAMINAFYTAGIVSVVLFICGFSASIFFVRQITLPIVKLTRAAESVERGDYDVRAIESVSERTDEFGQLSRVFKDMARRVDEREKALKKQFEQLRIDIDRRKQAEDVAEIVETDYFRDLKSKAREIRRSRTPGQGTGGSLPNPT